MGVIRYSPNDARPHIFLAGNLYYGGRPEEAIIHAKKAMRLEPYYPAWFLISLAGPYEMAGRYEEAIATWKQLYEHALRGEFPPINTHIGMARNYARLDRMEEARVQVAEILKIKPDYSVESFLKIRHFKDRAYLESLANLLIKVGYACAWLAMTCSSLGLLDEGITYGKRAKEISTSVAQDQYLYFKSRAALGFVYFFQGKSKETYNSGKTILEYGRQNSNIRSQVMGYWIMAFSYILDGNRSAAIECLERALQISADPFYSQFVKLFLGNVYTAAGQFSKAESILNEVASYCREFGCELFEDMIQPDLETIRKSKMDLSEN